MAFDFSQQQGQVLAMLSGQYAPLAAGIPYQPSFGFEGTPLGANPILGMLLQPAAAAMMGRMGMSPTGLSDRNVFDTFQNQRFFRMQMDLQQRVASLDRESWMSTFRGVAHMTGTPWGRDQMLAAGRLADQAAVLSPIMSQVAPDLMDEMAGYRGSAAVMAGRMMMAGRYRLDPVTGRLGQDPERVADLSKRLFEDLYVRGGMRETQGISAGQYGQLYEQLSARGLVSGATLAPSAAGGVPSFDADRVKASLGGYLQAVNAVRDIFGDMGKPNAPMAELIGALSALTSGSLAQIQPQNLNMMVRMTQQMANATGVGLDNALVMQQHLSGRATQMGLEPVFAVGANQGGMAFGAAARAQGIKPMWGQMDPDQLTQADSQLRLNAAASRAATRAGLAIRLDQQLGHFDPTSDAGRYVEALKTAQDTGYDKWTDTAGNSHSLNLSQREFSRLMVGTGKVTGGELEAMMNQKFAAREFVQQYGLGDVIRRTQPAEVIKWVGGQTAGFLNSRLQQAGLSPDAARHAANAASAGISSSIMNMSREDFADSGTRQRLIAEAINTNLKNANVDLGDVFNQQTGASLYGYMSQAVQFSRDYGYLQNLPRMHQAFHGQTLDAAARIQVEQRLTAQVRTAMAPLNRGSAIRRAFGYLQSATPGQADLVHLIGTALGGVSDKDVQNQLLPEMNAIKLQQEKVQKAQNDLMKETDPAKRQALATMFQTELDTLNQHVVKVGEAMSRLNVNDDMISEADTTRAMNIMSAGDARQKGSAAGDLAMRVLSGSNLVRYGQAGIDAAEVLNSTNREILTLAASYTAGDVAKLSAGELDPSVSAEQKKEIMTRVQALEGARADAVKNIHGMRGQAMSADTAIANQMGSDMRAKAVAYGQMAAGDKKDAALAELGEIWARRHPGEAVPLPGLMVAAAGAYGDLEKRAAMVNRLNTSTPEALANEFLGKYGVTGGTTDELKKLGDQFKSEAGQALFTGLTGGMDYLAKVAAGGGAKGTKVEAVDQLYTEYGKIAAADPKDRKKLEEDFRVKYALQKTEDFSRFQEAVKLQEETGFIHFGEGGKRTEFAIGKATELMDKKVATGKVGDGSADRPLHVVFPENAKMTIDGHLAADGKVTGTGTINSQGANHAATSGGGP